MDPGQMPVALCEITELRFVPIPEEAQIVMKLIRYEIDCGAIADSASKERARCESLPKWEWVEPRPATSSQTQIRYRSARTGGRYSVRPACYRSFPFVDYAMLRWE